MLQVPEGPGQNQENPFNMSFFTWQTLAGFPPGSWSEMKELQDLLSWFLIVPLAFKVLNM